MKARSRFFSRLALVCATFLSVPLVLSIGISNYLNEDAPEVALAVNPLDGEAQLNFLIERLAAVALAPGTAGLAELRTAAGRRIALAPADARGYSLLAETYYLAGDEPMAAELFDRALRYSKTEIHALQRSFEMLARAGRFAEAMERIDLISRRWPGRFSAVAPHLAAMLREPEAYDKALELLRGSPPWASRFFRALSGDEAGLIHAYRLQVDLNAGGGEEEFSGEAEYTMRALIRAGQHQLAHRLFLFTQSEQDRRVAGYVFNGDFSLRPGGRPFDWRVQDNASAEARWIEAEPAGGEVRIRFLGKPVKNVGVSQALYLPAGSYMLTMRYSAAGLEIPRGLHLRLACVDSRREITRIKVPRERAEDAVLSVGFEIGPADCGLFRLTVETALIADSFLYAYRGTVTLHSVHVDRLGDDRA